MFKLLGLIFVIFRELIFNDKEEMNPFSKKFNDRKFLTFLLLVVSTTMNGLLFYRAWDLAGVLSQYKEKVVKLEQEYTPQGAASCLLVKSEKGRSSDSHSQ